MKERPILFQGAMVRALLAGTKTQTRRIVKLPEFVAADMVEVVRWQDGYPDGERRVIIDYGDDVPAGIKCPYGAAGDRLWVKETWSPHRPHLRKTTPRLLKKREVLNFAADFAHTDDVERLGPWQSPLFMMRHMSRLTLEIADVRVERLQNISADDAWAEGLELDGEGIIWVRGTRPQIEAYDPIDCYRLLWESINGAGSWALNPWVWVVDFRKGVAA